MNMRSPILLSVAVLATSVALPSQALTPQQTTPENGLAQSIPVTVSTHKAPDGRVFAMVGPVLIELSSHSVRTSGFRLLVQKADGKLVPENPGPVQTYRGSIVGLPGTIVAASILHDGFYGRIVTKRGENYWIQPDKAVAAKKGRHLLYRAEDTIRGTNGCGTDKLANPRPGVRRIPVAPTRKPAVATVPSNGGSTSQSSAPQVAELACDADYEYYVDYGSSATNVNNRIESVINTMNLQYERDVNVTHEITTTIIRTSSSSQPYTSSDAVTLLNQMRTEWNANQGGVNRDIAHLFTGKSVNGGTIGIAWIGVICHGSYGYGLVESDFNNNFACATDLSAHELGHNWNAQHCGCRRNTMNSSITCANAFHSKRTIPVITSFRDSVGCLGSGGGTPTSVSASVNTTTPGAGKGRKFGRAVVTITDNLGNAISGAQVTGTFSGDIVEGPFTVTTNSSGIATFQTTGTLKGKISETFCVTAVTASLPWSQSPSVCDSN
jgi:hypothetical protein